MGFPNGILNWNITRNPALPPMNQPVNVMRVRLRLQPGA